MLNPYQSPLQYGDLGQARYRCSRIPIWIGTICGYVVFFIWCCVESTPLYSLRVLLAPGQSLYAEVHKHIFYGTWLALMVAGGCVGFVYSRLYGMRIRSDTSSD